MFDREGNILDQTGGTYFACAAYGREDTRAHCPVFTCQLWVGGKGCWLAQLILLQHLLQRLIFLLQFSFAQRVCTNQSCTRIFWQSLQLWEIFLHSTHRLAVEELSCGQ